MISRSMSRDQSPLPLPADPVASAGDAVEIQLVVAPAAAAMR